MSFNGLYIYFIIVIISNNSLLLISVAEAPEMRVSISGVFQPGVHKVPFLSFLIKK